MYRKEQIKYVSEPIMFLRNIVNPNQDIHVFLYDNVKEQDSYQLTRSYSLSISLFADQYALDEDRSMLYLSPNVVGQHIRVVYYTEGQENPFYAASNLNRFITNVLRWMENRIIDGLFVYWSPYDQGSPVKYIKQGSFVYDGWFYVYPGGVFDIREQAPPTIKRTFRSYLIFINDEIIQSYVYRQNQTLNQLGIIHSTSMNNDLSITKQEVDDIYDSRYGSEALKVAYVHVYLMDSFEYEVWVSYPQEARSM